MSYTVSDGSPKDADGLKLALAAPGASGKGGQDGELPAEIYIPLVDALYADIKSMYIGSAAVALAALLVAFKNGEFLIYLCAAAIVIVTAARARDIRAFVRIRPQLTTAKQVRRWEDRYTIGAAIYAALLGGWTFLTFYLTTDPFSWLFSFAVTLAYLVGTPGRNFASNRLVTAQIIGEGVPLTAALLYAGGFYYAVFGLVLLPFFLALKFISDRLRHTLLDAVIANRDVGLIARRFDTALNNMPHGLAMFDAERRLVVSNRRLAEIFGLSAGKDRLGQTIHDLTRESVTAGKILQSEVEAFSTSFENRLEARHPDGLVNERNDGQVLNLTFQPMENGGSVVVVEDITARRVAEARINELARFDMLTGLPNRMHMGELMRAALANAGSRPCAIHFLDISGFKQVNDTLGHQVGDSLLRSVADRLRFVVRETDLIGRFGDDEFAILQTLVTGRDDAAAFAERMVEMISGAYDIEGNRVIVGASVGVAISPSDASGVDELLKIADMALYWAKQDREKSYCFFEPGMDSRAQARRQLELDLREALANNAFQVHYQPIIDLEHKKISTCEALARWLHPDRGMVPPSEFIPVVEEMGLITELGEWVMREACRACADWPDDIRVAVNLSVIQFKTGDIIETIRRAVADAGLAPNRLEIEITESLLLQDSEMASKKLRAIRELGVRVSLDDFGTGYSNLSYLQSLPLTKVKIDRSFVPEDGADARAGVLLRGMANLGAELGLTVTVEGIETPEQLNLMMAEKSVTEVQGFLFSPAIPAREIKTLLDTGSIEEQMVA
ncbi:MAG: putative bifunctional diguanylate cyclase/phosphodiesterase [Alphaproteobacteria bacterium]